MAASGTVQPLGRGLDISLAALRRHDPYIQRIMDVASQVALYTFSHRANEWEKTDVEGTLFVYTRSASPKHGFTIMNRLSMENRTEPITKDLEFQLQDPFLLYRNARFLIYGIWFYSKEECQRIAELMKNLTQQEQEKAQQVASVSPMMLHSEGKEVDILQMLNKAKDEYTKCKTCSEPKMIASSSAIHTNPNLIKPIAVKPSDPSSHLTNIKHSKRLETELEGRNLLIGLQPSRSFTEKRAATVSYVDRYITFEDPEPQHLSLTTLFGKAEKAPPEGPEHREPSAARPGVVRSLSYEEPSRLSEIGDKQLCPAIQKLMVRGTDLLPVAEIPENQNGSAHPPGDVFSSLFLSLEDVNPLPAPEPESGDSLRHRLADSHSADLQLDPGLLPATHCYCTAATSSHGKMAGNAPVHFNGSSQQSERTPSDVLAMPPVSGTISPQELLKKLNLVRQDQQIQASSKPPLAAKFSVVSQASVKPTCEEKLPQGEKPNPLLQVISPQRIPATVSPSLLLSPLVFSQTSAQKSADITRPLFSDTDSKTNLLLPVSLSKAPSKNLSGPSDTLTKSQLCDTLIHLIQNDDSFVNTIYETYLSAINTRGKF